MFVRVTTLRGYLHDLDPAVVVARDQIVPRLEQHHGFEGAMLIVDRVAEIGLAISLWKNEADLADSDNEERQLMKAAARAFEVTADISNCEVLYSTVGAALVPNPVGRQTQARFHQPTVDTAERAQRARGDSPDWPGLAKG